MFEVTRKPKRQAASRERGEAVPVEQEIIADEEQRIDEDGDVPGEAHDEVEGFESDEAEDDVPEGSDFG